MKCPGVEQPYFIYVYSHCLFGPNTLSKQKEYKSSVYFTAIKITFLIINHWNIKCTGFSITDLSKMEDGQLKNIEKRTNKYKKHLDASVKERPQTLLVPSEEICKRVLCNKHI